MSLDPKKTYIPDATVKVFDGLTVDWYNGHQVVAYKLEAVSEDIVNKWAKHVMDTLENWDKAHPYLAIHDLSKPGVSLQFAALVNFDMMNIGITMGGRIACESLFDEHEDWYGRVAIKFNLSLSGQTNRTLMNYLNQDHPRTAYKTFYNRTKCLRWLTTGITDTSEMKAVEDVEDKADSDKTANKN